MTVPSGAAGRERLTDPTWLTPLVALLSLVAINAFEGLAVIAVLPEIGADLGQVDYLPLVLSSFLSASAVASLLAGPLIDARGPRPVMLLATGGFAIGSVIAALAPSLSVLIVGRLVQGAGSGLALTLVFASVGMIFPTELTARVFAANSLVFSLAGFGGPLVAAGLLQLVGWRGVLGVITPFAIASAILAWPRLPAVAPRPVAVAPSIVAAVTLATLAIVAAAEVSLLPGLALLVVGGVAAVAAVRLNAKARRPLLDPVLMAGPAVRHLHLSPGLQLLGFVCIAFYVPILMRVGFGWSASATVFAPMPATVGWTVGAQLTGWMLDRVRAERWHVVGATWLVVATALPLLGLTTDRWIAVLAGVFVFGMGMGISLTVAITRLRDAVAVDELGRANAVSAFARTIGATVGAAIGGAVFFGAVRVHIGDVERLRDAFSGQVALSGELADAARAGFIAVHAVTLTVGLLALWSVRRSVDTPWAPAERA